ncbi:hypothetical protein L227DRAFT_572649 [Lentinus tigrinus ALCF2SS1-6]|uniref:Uncharacterized protein n=1 Tax=Lentinus tigrinus ALCF2SS1-6 TaxID=1328759 RepID=A0A5C2SK35_9APHY|nr:hypothetical protein L227DRAFT_572649 [Lentinus tigrinus ALCF2SS1-6]
MGGPYKRIRREHSGRKWEEEELEALGNGAHVGSSSTSGTPCPIDRSSESTSMSTAQSAGGLRRCSPGAHVPLAERERDRLADKGEHHLTTHDPSRIQLAVYICWVLVPRLRAVVDLENISRGDASTGDSPAIPY